jgi:Skp family chaperone for outer membrane proteins
MKKMMKTILLAAAVGLFAGTGTRAADNPILTAPVKAVYGHYLKIQADLANDSLTGVSENAETIVKAVQTDAKALPSVVAAEAEALAKASDLKSARGAFKPLSDSLIQYLADHKAKGVYVQVYCPMARASWLQADKNVNNPYFGQAMARCGEIQN